MRRYSFIAGSLVLVAMAVCVWAVPAECVQPKQRIVRPDSPADTKQRQEEENKKQAAQNAAIQDLVNKEIQIQQQMAEKAKSEIEESQQNIAIQRELAGYTKDLIVVGAVEGLILFGTLLVVRRQAKLIKQQTIISHRARLVVGELQKPIGHQIRLPVENYGQFDGKITSIDTKIKVLNPTQQEVILSKFEDNIERVVIPGDANAVSLALNIPNNVDIFGQNTHLTVSGTIKYETGMKDVETLPFCKFFSAKNPRGEDCYSAIEIDFTETENQKQQAP